jgi:hypothetical protein
MGRRREEMRRMGRAAMRAATERAMQQRAAPEAMQRATTQPGRGAMSLATA